MLPAGDEEPAIPGWMEKVDAFGPARAAATGIALTAFNPKNLILTLAGTAAIVEASISAGEQAIALTVFTVIASLGVATPVVMYFVLGERARPLARLKNWMARYNGVIMAVILLLIGAKLVGDAIRDFSG